MQSELTVSVSPVSSIRTASRASVVCSPDQWASPVGLKRHPADDFAINLPQVVPLPDDTTSMVVVPNSTRSPPSPHQVVVCSEPIMSPINPDNMRVQVHHIVIINACVMLYDAIFLAYGLSEGLVLVFIASVAHMGVCALAIGSVLLSIQANTVLVVAAIETVINCHVVAQYRHFSVLTYVPAIAMIVPICLIGCSVKSNETTPVSSEDSQYLPQPQGKHKVCFFYLAQVLSSCIVVSAIAVMLSGSESYQMPIWVEFLCVLAVICPLGCMFHNLVLNMPSYREKRVTRHNTLDINESPLNRGHGHAQGSIPVRPARTVWDSPLSPSTTIHSTIHSLVLNVTNECDKTVVRDNIERGPDANSLIDSESRKGSSINMNTSDNDTGSMSSIKSDSRRSKNLRFEKDQKREPLVQKPPHPGKLLGRRKSFSFRNIEWRRGEILGRGGFGSVYIGLNEATGQLMAVKSLQFDVKDHTILAKTKLLQNEIALMKTLEHPNIVSYYFTERVGNCINIFMEYVPGGSLLQVIKQFGPLGDVVASTYTEQILYGLSYLHSQSVIHRDIKCANVLVSTDGVCKLGDFGSAIHISKMLPKDQVGIQGTPVWMAPEVITEQGHDWRCDIWSLGCTVMEMLTGQPPFSHYNMTPICTMHEVISSPLRLPETSRLVGMFLNVCLNKVPEQRPSAEDLLGHAWIRDSYECDTASYAEEPTPKHEQTTLGSSVLSPRTDSLSVSSAKTWSSKGSRSTRYSETMKGKPPKGLSEKDNNTLLVRKLHAVKVDIEKRASLMLAKKACANVMVKKPEQLSPEEGEDNSMLKIMLGEQRCEVDEDTVFCLPPKFHHAIAPTAREVSTATPASEQHSVASRSESR